MNFSQQDFDETIMVAEYVKSIDKIDAQYVDAISDEIFHKQPFFLSVFLGYRFDVYPDELEEIMKIYFIIWEYFKSNPGVQTKKVTEQQFEHVQDKNIKLLSYLDAETKEYKRRNLIAADITNFRSKALFSAVFLRYETRPVLLKMDPEKRIIILIGIRSFIECFESL